MKTPTPPPSKFPAAALEKLAAFYLQFGSQQTIHQKITNLEGDLGKSQFYATGGGDVPDEAKLACLESEWLACHYPDLIELELA